MRVRLSDAATSTVLAEHYRMQAEVCHQMARITKACATRGGSSAGLRGIVRKIYGTSPKSANLGGKKPDCQHLRRCRRILLVAGMIGETARPVARHHGPGGVVPARIHCALVGVVEVLSQGG